MWMRRSLTFCSARGIIQHATHFIPLRATIPTLIRTMASEAQSISAPPADRQLITHNGKRYTTVKEGLAYILTPETANDGPNPTKETDEVQQVFYNPIQQFNRDLTVLAIKAYGKEKLEEKDIMRQERMSKLAEKKRKRQEQTGSDDRPTKAQKISDTPAPESGITASSEGKDAVDATSAPAESGPATAPLEAGTELRANNCTQPGPDDPNGDKSQTTLARFTILDALSATGLRALRYTQEIPLVTSVTSNDLLASAIESIKLNVEHNKLQDKINVSHDDAIAHMYTLVAKELRRKDTRGRPTKSERYDVVDLDPYGTAAPFLDAAVQAVRDDGGLLCVTCTDSGVWASNGYPEKAYSLYGGIPMKGGMQSHEGGLRLILHAIESSAARYGLAMEPLLSLSIDFYARVFVRIRRSPASVKFQAGKNMIVYNCDAGCGAWTTQLLARNKPVPNKKGSGHYYKHVFAPAPTANQHCEHCGSVMHLSGPMYAGRLHSPSFVKRVLEEARDASTDIYGTVNRVQGMLQTALEEFLPTPEEAEALEGGSRMEGVDPEQTAPETKSTEAVISKEDELAAIDPYPFFFIPTQIAGKLHCVTPPESPLRGALIGLGYRVTRSHCKPGSMKTDAPWSVIWHVMREWVRQKAPVKEENIKPESPAYRLLRLGKREDSGTSEDGSKVADGEKMEVVFDEKVGKDPTKGLYLRYQTNPRENWGPMNRAKGR